MKNTPYYDVIVVGAGPAGSTAARATAEHGMSTLLLERDEKVGLPVKCGELTSLEAVSKYVDIPERCISRRVKGGVFYAPDGTAFKMESKNEHSIVLDRSIFDNLSLTPKTP